MDNVITQEELKQGVELMDALKNLKSSRERYEDLQLQLREISEVDKKILSNLDKISAQGGIRTRTPD